MTSILLCILTCFRMSVSHWLCILVKACFCFRTIACAAGAEGPSPPLIAATLRGECDVVGRGATGWRGTLRRSEKAGSSVGAVRGRCGDITSKLLKSSPLGHAAASGGRWADTPPGAVRLRRWPGVAGVRGVAGVGAEKFPGLVTSSCEERGMLTMTG